VNIMKKITDEAGWVSCKAPQLMLRSLRDLGTQGSISRELRLYACACVRQIDELLEFEQSRKAVDIGERYADGHASQKELKAAFDAAKLAESWIVERIRRINTDALASSGREVVKGWRLVEIADWHPEARRRKAARAAGHCARTLVLSDNIDPNLKYCGDWNIAVAASRAAFSASASRENLDALRAMFLANDGGGAPLYDDDWQADLLRCVFRNPLRPISTVKLEAEPQIREMAESIYWLRAFERLPDLGEHFEAIGSVDSDLISHCINARVHARGCRALDLARGLKRDY
jgi:hypothetical protein